MTQLQYQLLPPLTDDEYHALKRDIAKRGVQVPVEYDDQGNILDGHHRVRICRELGIDEWPRVVRVGMDEDAKAEHVLALNLDRRHLSRKQRRALVAKLRGQGWSYRRIGDKLGVGEKTAWRDAQKQDVSNDTPATVIGKDGKEYPARREEPANDVPLETLETVEKEMLRDPAIRDAYARIREAPGPDEDLPIKETPSIAVHFSSDSHEWYTPERIVERVTATLGEIDLDPCSNSKDDPAIPAHSHLTAEDDGLSMAWFGRVYMNPPYGRQIADWISYLVREYEAERVSAAVALVPSRTDTQWFRELREYPRCFIWGRLQFSGCENTAPFPSMAVYLGDDVASFIHAFEDIGDIYALVENQN